uniref:hypothetical protein n=1 Tax=Enterocloster clostridioformis TaxID=1531 RepID=UPI0026757EA2|nr:hypothetical protein [Enterocloster clostridioformis]
MKPGSVEGKFITSIPAGTNDNVLVYAFYERNTSSSSGGGGGGGSSSGGRKISTSSSSQNMVGLWKQDKYGWWFQKQDGSYPKVEWIMNNKWYRFDTNGYMQSGWVELNKVKYLLNPDGSMISNDWSFQDGKWYFFNESGAMQTGWVKWKDKCIILTLMEAWQPIV